MQIKWQITKQLQKSWNVTTSLRIEYPTYVAGIEDREAVVSFSYLSYVHHMKRFYCRFLSCALAKRTKKETGNLITVTWWFHDPSVPRYRRKSWDLQERALALAQKLLEYSSQGDSCWRTAHFSFLETPSHELTVMRNKSVMIKQTHRLLSSDQRWPYEFWQHTRNSRKRISHIKFRKLDMFLFKTWHVSDAEYTLKTMSGEIKIRRWLTSPCPYN